MVNSFQSIRTQQYHGHRVESHLAAFEVYLRKNKIILMTKAVKHAFALEVSYVNVLMYYHQNEHAMHCGKSHH